MGALHTLDLRVLQLLTDAAEGGLQCPTNSEIGVYAEMLSPSAASEAVTRLERAGRIIVYRGQCTRKVTIVATGKSTRGDVPEPHWRNRAADERAPSPKRPAPTRHTVTPGALSRDENLAARIEADQQRLVERRLKWLELERKRYKLPRRGRLIEEMVA